MKSRLVEAAYAKFWAKGFVAFLWQVCGHSNQTGLPHQTRLGCCTDLRRAGSSSGAHRQLSSAQLMNPADTGSAGADGSEQSAD